MKKNTNFTLLFYLIISLLEAQNPLAQFSFSGCVGCDSFPADAQPKFGYLSNIQQNNIIEGSYSNKFRATNWTTDTTPDVSKYYFFKIKPNSKYLLNLSKIELDEARNTIGIRQWCVRSSLDNFTTNLAHFEVPDDTKTRTAQTINLDANFQNLNQEIEFRFYAYQAESATGNWTIDNLKIYGDIPDIVSPELLEIKGQNQNQLKCIFSEKVSHLSALNPENYTFHPDLKIKNINFQYQDNQVVILNFDTNLMPNTNYETTVKNIKDEVGNTLQEQTKNFHFTDNSPPEVSDITPKSPYAIDVFFDEKITKNSAENLTNYQVFDKDSLFFASPVSAILSPQNAQKITLFFNVNFEENDTYELLVSNLEDASGNQNTLNQNYFRLDTRKPKVEEVKAISQTQIELYFSEIIDPVYAKNFTNYIIDNQIGIPIQIKLISDKKVQLIFQEKLKENQEYRIKVSNLRDMQNNIMSNQYISFRYDITSPKITKTDMLPNYQVRLIFDESLDKKVAENLQNYRITSLNQTPLKAELSPFFANIVTLTFPVIPTTNDVELVISNLQDLHQNIAQNPDKQIINFSKLFLYSVNILSKNEISIHFSQPLQKNSAENSSNYFINQNIGNPTQATLNTQDFTTVTLKLAHDLELLEKYKINVSEIIDIKDDKAQNLSYEFSYQNYVNMIYPISENGLNITFEYPPSKSDAENPAMYEIMNFSTPLFAIQDLKNPNIIHLQFTSVFESNKTYELKINNLILLSGHLTPVQTHFFVYDNRPPYAESVTMISNQELIVKFSEPISDNVEKFLNFFEVNQGMGYPSEIKKDTNNPNLVSLKYTKSFQSITQYILSINYIEDLQKNRMVEAQQVPFQRPNQPQKYDILFNEIFADPEPSVNLPVHEFLELYNNSDVNYDLGGLQLSDENTSKILTHFELKSGKFVILCSKEAQAEYQKYGHVLALDSWLSLTNSGKKLILKDWDGNVIDSLKYSDTWYKNSEKKAGGWSLEKTDYQVDCIDSEIWQASKDSSGGTPAKLNSVYQNYSDDLATEIKTVKILEPNRLQLGFSQPAEKVALQALKNYRFEPYLSLKEVLILDTQNIELKLYQEIDSSSIYTIYISNLYDCAGNFKNDTAQFAIGQKALKNDVIISEIMPKESEADTLQQAEYIEIFNRSDKLISLKSIILEDATSQVNLPEYFLQTGEYLVLTLPQNTPFFSHVLGVPNFPSLNNSGEKLSLRDTSNYEIFSVTYSDSLFKKLPTYQGGYALEIKDIHQENTPDNWSISGHLIGGTPAQKNQPMDNFEDILTDTVTINNYSLEIKKVDVINATQIDVIFSKKIPENMKSTIFVFLQDNELNGTFMFLDSTKLRINLEKSLDFNTVYQLKISYQQSDSEYEQKLYYFNIAINKKELENYLLITEIMADELPVVALPETEYIELYNRSDSIIDLAQVQFEDEKSKVILPQYYLYPQSFVVICPKNKQADFNNSAVIGTSNFPSLNNSGENLKLRNIQNQEIIFSLTYDIKWYQDDDKDNGGWALEMCDLNSNCQGKNNWKASQNSLGGTPAQANSVYPDSSLWEAPNLIEIMVKNDTNLCLKFDSDLDTNSVQMSSFTLSNGLQIMGLEIISPNEIILITNRLSGNKKYKIELNEIQNCYGTMTEKEIFEFLVGVQPAYHELKITEMMLDPMPPVNLPEIEYFEVYNPTEKIISLANLQVTNRADAIQFPTYHLAPHHYLLVCDKKHIQDFKNQFSGIKILGIDNLFSLKNTNSSLAILSDSKLIFAVEYDASFYKHPEKDFGGWSLEMRDVNYNCASSQNWEASQNENGGTPAMPNSVATEITNYHVPNLIKTEVINVDSVVLFFDQELDFSKIDNFQIVLHEQTFQEIKSIFRYDNASILMTLKDTLKYDKIYTVQVQNIYACNGKVQLTKQVQTFRLPEIAQREDILLNEILFNPPVGGTDFIELYNNSYKYINLKNWYIGNQSDTNSLTSENYIIAPYEYVILTSSIDKFKYFYPMVNQAYIIETKLVSMPDLEGTVIIFNPEKIQIDRVDYSEEWHSDLLNSVEGISLERISIHSETNSYANWTSSAFPDYATPAQLNSQVQSENSTKNIDQCIRFNTELISPNQDGFDDFLMIEFDCLPIGTVGNIDIYDFAGRKITQLIQNQLLSTQYPLRWDGIDATGNKVRSGYFIIYFELYDDVGNVQRIRKKIAVATPLD